MRVYDLICRFGCLLPFIVLSSLSAPAVSAQYNILDLGEGSAVAVNDLGHAIINQSGVAYFYDGESVISIGDLGIAGTVTPGGLNENDEVVGTHRPTGSPTDTSVAYYDGSSWLIIGKFGGDFAYASDINDNGLITGAYKPSGSGYQAFIYNVSTTDFNDLPSYSDAMAINTDGWIAGTETYITTGTERA